MKLTPFILGTLGIAAGALVIWGIVRLINSKSRRKKWILVIASVVMAMSYPLSFGPYMRLVVLHDFSAETGLTVYGPLFWLTEKTGTDSFLDWYAHLWVPPRPEILWDNEPIAQPIDR